MRKIDKIQNVLIRNLEKRHDPKDIPCLKALALDWGLHYDTRRSALNIIAGIGGKKATDALEDISWKSDDWVKTRARSLARELRRGEEFKCILPAVEVPAT